MPRKPIPKCPDQLQEMLDDINRLPAATGKEWTEFFDLIRRIWKRLDRRRVDPSFVSLFEDRFELENRIMSRFGRFVRNLAPEKFRDFTLNLSGRVTFGASLNDLLSYILLTKSQRASLHEIIRTAQDNDGGGIIQVKTETLIAIENWLLTAVNYHDPIGFLLAHQMPIDRLNICSICDKVYWQNYQGKIRKAETCGDYECSYTLANLKRKASRRGDENHGSL